MYETDYEPAMRCIGTIRAVTLCADVACLAWVWRMRGQVAGTPAGVGATLCSLKPCLQKRLKKRTDCGGKHLGCLYGAKKGLQCGLSGNRVARKATPRRDAERGTASIGNERCVTGKSNPYLSRKIYLFCRRRLSKPVLYPLSEVRRFEKT